MTPARHLATFGWVEFAPDDASLNWARAANQLADGILDDPAMRAQWLQCEGTWFVGVDALPSDPAGVVSGVPLAGAAVDVLGPLPPLHPAQLSVIYPGYPKPRAGDNAANFRYRRDRFAAHVDGLIAEGPERRRKLREPHAFVLGIALNSPPPSAAPLVVWEGSHKIMQAAFAAAFAALPPESWPEADVTDVYVSARKEVFEACRPKPLPLEEGGAVIVHRMALHGISPWPDTADSHPEGRRIAYFRPQLPGGIADWLSISG